MNLPELQSLEVELLKELHSFDITDPKQKEEYAKVKLCKDRVRDMINKETKRLKDEINT